MGGPSAGGGWLLVCELVSCWAVGGLAPLYVQGEGIAVWSGGGLLAGGIAVDVGSGGSLRCVGQRSSVIGVCGGQWGVGGFSCSRCGLVGC